MVALAQLTDGNATVGRACEGDEVDAAGAGFRIELAAVLAGEWKRASMGTRVGVECLWEGVAVASRFLCGVSIGSVVVAGRLDERGFGGRLNKGASFLG